MKTVVYAALTAALLCAGLGFFLFRQLVDGTGTPGSRETDFPGDAAEPVEAPERPDPGARDVVGALKPRKERTRLPSRASLEREEKRSAAPKVPATAKKTMARDGPIPKGPGRIVVETLGSSGEPFADVAVTLESDAGRAEAVTGEEGIVSFDRIAAGSYTLRLRASEAPELVSARRIALAPGEDRRLSVRIRDFDLSIAGRVVNQEGAPVPGILVEAVSYLFQAHDTRFIAADQRGQRAMSDKDGFYEIRGLADGEYEVSTVATDVYPSAKTIVRSGVHSADIRLLGARSLQVYGKVLGPDAHPLEGALVMPVGQASRQTRSAKDGSYSVEIALTRKDRVYSFIFRLEGYRDLRRNLPGDEVFDAGAVELDVLMEPLGPTAPISGVLVAADNGDLIAGETVYLHSPTLNARYVAVSDDSGSFYREVQVAGDYRLWINPRQSFRDVSKYPLAVPEKGLELEIQLEPLATGRLTGRMVDNEGRPLPHYSLWVRSTHAVASWVKITGDDQGRFLLEDAPAGNLLFDTRSSPYVRAQGVNLPVGGEKDVEIVIDWGTHEAEGTVVDGRGSALAGVRVQLQWSHTAKGVVSSSSRTVVTDENGGFRFMQLGPGTHRLIVSAPGYRRYQRSYDVGSKTEDRVVRIRLEEEG